MVAWGSPAPWLGTPNKKELTEEEKVQEAEKLAYQKEADTLLELVTKMREKEKLELELALAKQAASKSSPALFAATKPSQLDFRGLTDLNQMDRSQLAKLCKDIYAWLEETRPQVAKMSTPKKEKWNEWADIQKRMIYLVDRNAKLEEEKEELKSQNKDLTKSLRVQAKVLGAYDDDDDDADPLYAAEVELKAQQAKVAKMRAAAGIRPDRKGKSRNRQGRSADLATRPLF